MTSFVTPIELFVIKISKIFGDIGTGIISAKIVKLRSFFSAILANSAISGPLNFRDLNVTMNFMNIKFCFRWGTLRIKVYTGNDAKLLTREKNSGWCENPTLLTPTLIFFSDKQFCTVL